ncbi:uncharacterized protein [Eucyclogobius newberryi]|uniref:uncharacterized protein n=1 Tax=Eucyclogobius newberryi TaxID=166745 RepID=UPI003B5C930B
MAFSNLFTQLCDLERTVKDPSRRNEFKSGRGCSSKRKPQTMQTGPHVKWRCLQPYAADVSDAVRNEDPKAPEDQRFNWANNNPRPGVSSDNYQYTENADNTHKKKKKKNKGKKWRENSARYRKAKREPRKPLMSKEFKAQHSMEVDGRLLCIYFLRGKCIKGEECQFEHIEGYNGLIKAACKFYIQGFCLKGKNCPYLHDILSPSA